MKQYVKPIKCGDHTHETWDAASACWRKPLVEDNRNHPESIGDKLERLGACGQGYPGSGLPCVRPNGHSSPISDCFALVENEEGAVVGCYMQQDGKDWVTDPSQFPRDIVISTPLFKERIGEAKPDRRGLVAHSKEKPCNP